jgi:hypothetical protein
MATKCIQSAVSLQNISKKSATHLGAKAELRTYEWTMPSYIILNITLCCDIYLFCLVLESACLLSRAFYLQVTVLFLEIVILTFDPQT